MQRMSRIQDSIDVNVPVRKAYDQWTQFEEFPRFMEGVLEVRQLDDRRLRWRARVGGVEETWEARITEQQPDQRIAWKSIAGRKNSGVVTFHRLNDDACTVMLQLDWEPEGIVENVGDALGAAKLRIHGDLQRFKQFMEERGGQPTGAWRGHVPPPHA
jgi:uncharacterized membrane protein